MKFVSHLDLNRFIIRLFRMAKIPVWYTEGFNQHPYISFALPLSLGFESLYEILDFKITDDDYSLDKLICALNEKTVPGIKFLEAFEEVRKAKEIGFSKYKITFNNGMEKDFYNYLTSAKEILVDKKAKKGGVNKIEISKFLKSVELNDNSVSLTIPAGSELNINPTLYIFAFFELKGINVPYSVLRTEIYDNDLNLFR